MLKITITHHDDHADDGTRVVKLVPVTPGDDACELCDDPITDAVCVLIAYDDDTDFRFSSTHHVAHLSDPHLVSSVYDD